MKRRAINGVPLTVRRSPQHALMGWLDGASAGHAGPTGSEVLLEVLRAAAVPQLEAARAAAAQASASSAGTTSTEEGASSSSAKKKAKKKAAERRKQASALVRLSDPSAHSVFVRAPMPRQDAVRAARVRDAVERRAAYVSDRSGGAVLYVPLHEDMEGDGFAELMRALHRPRVDGEGVLDASVARALLVDVRGNAGGNISASVLAALRAWRVPLGLEGIAGVLPAPVPSRACVPAAAAALVGGGGGDDAVAAPYPGVNAPSPHEGVVVLLMDANTSSDAEVLCAAARHYGAADAAVGETRTYGGVLGYDAEPSVGVGLTVTVPSVGMRLVGVGRGGSVEGVGVSPDVKLAVATPAHYFAEEDPTLVAASDVVDRLLAAQTARMSDAQREAVSASRAAAGGLASAGATSSAAPWNFAVWRRLDSE